MVTKEQAEVMWYKAQAIAQLIYAGYTHESVRDAVNNNNLSILEKAESGEKK